jgi:ribosome-binding protein aMBF1 (putative translation factor)
MNYTILVKREYAIQIIGRRVELNMSQEDLSKLTDIDINIIKKIEQYNYPYDKKLIDKIKEVLEIELVNK